MNADFTIVEVGPRDGLQNEKVVLDPQTRLEFAERLAMAGINKIELSAFVSPKWVPQMAGASDLIREALRRQQLKESPLRNAEISALVPNLRGMNDALEVNLKNVAIFASASESFAKKNINCSIEESFERFAQVMTLASANGVRVRGYLSMCFGCPFEGSISESRVVELSERLLKMGVYEVSIGDTIGVATPAQVKSLGGMLVNSLGAHHVAMHFHDTRGTALANILASLDLGIRTFDSSLGGLGGCPYAPAATGNVATEDVLYMLHGMGLKSGIDLEALIPLNKWVSQKVGRELPSRVGRAGLPRLISSDS